MKKPFRTMALAAAILVVAAAVAVLVTGRECLVLTNDETNRRIAALPLAEDGFSVTFVHSVNKSPVEEFYEVRDGTIHIVGCIYSSTGAGVATEAGEGQHITYESDGSWHLWMDTEVDPLVYFVGTVSDHVLTMGEEEVSLRDLCGRSARVRFTVRRVPRIFVTDPSAY